MTGLVVGKRLGRERGAFSLQGNFMRRELQKAGLSLSQLEIVSSISKEKIRALQPRWVLAAGSEALQALTWQDKITEVRGQILACKLCHDALVIPTYDPAYLARVKRNMPEFRLDLDNFATVLNFPA